jgi:hypothetical protein
MGRKALRHSAVPPRFIACATHFALTNISLSYNVETTFRTTNTALAVSSHEQLERELQLISVECSFQRPVGDGTSLAASTSLLSSVTAFL